MSKMPSGGALFGSSTSGPGSTGGVKHLVEFRAGRMNLKGNMVHPDKRKGLLYIYQSEDSLMHFCWQDRHTGVVEDDLIIFPDDCEYVRVPQCTTGRVFVLKFKSSNRKLFFWMQEPRTDRDEDNCKRINEYLNNPPGNLPSSNAADQDLQSLLNNMSQSQLMQLFGGVGQIGGLSSLLGTMSRPSTGNRSGSGSSPAAIAHRPTVPTTPTTNTTGATPAPPPGLSTPTAAPAPPTVVPNAPRVDRTTTRTATEAGSTPTLNNPIQLADLQNFLQGIAPTASDQSVDLSAALTADALTGILNNDEAIAQLQSHLPAVDGTTTTQEQLRSTLASPQFQQAVSQFSSALQSGQLGPIVSQFAVNSEAVSAASQGNMREFVRALERTAAAAGVTGGTDAKPKEGDKTDKDDKKKPDNSNNEPKKDDDEGMQLD